MRGRAAGAGSEGGGGAWPGGGRAPTFPDVYVQWLRVEGAALGMGGAARGPAGPTIPLAEVATAAQAVAWEAERRRAAPDGFLDRMRDAYDTAMRGWSDGWADRQTPIRRPRPRLGPSPVDLLLPLMRDCQVSGAATDPLRGTLRWRATICRWPRALCAPDCPWCHGRSLAQEAAVA